MTLEEIRALPSAHCSSSGCAECAIDHYLKKHHRDVDTCGAISELADLLLRAVEALQGMTSVGVELDDPRIDYLTVQVGRADMEAARALLAELGALA